MGEVFRFGNCVLRVRERTLHREGKAVDLAPKELQTLTLLVQHAGQALSREWLIGQIWPDTVVGDTSLGRNISALRRHLGAETIRSLPKFGYRFTLPVVVEPDEAPSASAAESPSMSSAAVDHETTTVEQVIPIDRSPSAVLPHASEPIVQPVALTDEPEISSSTRTPFSGAQQGKRKWAYAAIGCSLGFITLLAVVFRGDFAVHRLPAAARRWQAEGEFSIYDGTAFRAASAFSKALELAPDSAMLHAQAADALSQLERTGDAQDHILLATDQRRTAHLSSADRHYVDAVRAMIARDFLTACAEFQAWRDALPEADRWKAEQDLGRAFATAGQTQPAMQHLQRSIELDPHNGGAYLKLARLKSLQRQWGDSNALLDKAGQVYREDSNLEGQAEIAYQRGTMDYQRNRYATAEALYESSLALSRQLGDPQLAGRAVGAMSTVERWQGRLPEARRHAEEALAMGRQSASEYGIAGSLTLLANVAIAQRDAATARPMLEEAIRLEDHVRNLRQTANAEYALAGLLLTTGEYDAAEKLAVRAQGHYILNHSKDGAANANLLLARLMAVQGRFREALGIAAELHQDALSTGSKRFEEESEDAMGVTLLQMGQATSSLPHLQRAVALANETDNQVWLKTLHLAYALTAQGQPAAARKLLATVESAKQQDPDAEQEAHLTFAHIALASGDPAQAIAQAEQAEHTALSPNNTARECALEVDAELRMQKSKRAMLAAQRCTTMPAFTTEYGKLQARALLARVSHVLSKRIDSNH